MSASGSGINVFGNGNRIEANSCTAATNGFGIHNFNGTGNLIIRNSCHGNTNNYLIVAGNRYGPVVDLTANNPNTVSGNAAGGIIGTVDPWANFAH
jgi:hypothetical protein